MRRFVLQPGESRVLRVASVPPADAGRARVSAALYRPGPFESPLSPRLGMDPARPGPEMTAAAQIAIDIVINNHNYARFLPAAIESACAQTHEKVNVIVVDDGSTDGSRQLLESYDRGSTWSSRRTAARPRR